MEERLHRIDQRIRGLRQVVERAVVVAAQHRDAAAGRRHEVGWSWGGVTSLAVPVNPRRTASKEARAGALVRFNVGLEDPADLIADLEGGLRALEQ